MGVRLRLRAPTRFARAQVLVHARPRLRRDHRARHRRRHFRNAEGESLSVSDRRHIDRANLRRRRRRGRRQRRQNKDDAGSVNRLRCGGDNGRQRANGRVHADDRRRANRDADVRNGEHGRDPGARDTNGEMVGRLRPRLGGVERRPAVRDSRQLALIRLHARQEVVRDARRIGSGRGYGYRAEKAVRRTRDFRLRQ